MSNIVEYIGQAVSLMRVPTKLPAAVAGITGAPFYMFGHIVEINNRLVTKGNDSANKSKRYPLVALKLDIPEKQVGSVTMYNLNIAILMWTNENYNAEQRLENVYKPILYPLYDLFVESLKNSGFMWEGDRSKPPHTKIDRYYYGKSETAGTVKNVKKIFTDPLDGIELLDLKINKRNC